MEYMERRRFLVLLPAAAAILRASESSGARQAHQGALGRAGVADLDGKLIPLERRSGYGRRLERRASGQRRFRGGRPDRSGGGRFTINPIHKRALFTYKDGRRLMVTYWCDVCAIRTYTPGICWCCREETALDLIEPDKVDKA